jgi:hypothetical protein
VNQHRLQLGNVGIELYKKNGQKAKVSDLQNINQKIDLWTELSQVNLLWKELCKSLDGFFSKIQIKLGLKLNRI